MVISFNIESTVLFVKKRGKLWQIIRLYLDKSWKSTSLSVLLDTGKWKKKYRIRPEDGIDGFFDMEVPELKEKTRCKATIIIDKERSCKEFILEPHKKWEVHVQNFTHTDIGYTDLPSRVADGYREAFKSIIDFCDQTRGFDDYSKYRWNIETGYWLDKALEGLDQSQLKKVKSLVKEGRIEICPLYVSHTSEFNDEETLIRSLYFAFQFARECGVKIETAMASDITGQPWLLPQILQKCGIKYFSTGVNTTMARALGLPRPFYWKSRDGSKVMLLDTDERQAYQEGVMMGLTEKYGLVIKKLPAYLKNLEEEGNFHFDLLALRTPGYPGDNTKPNINVSYIIKDWNSKWEYPKLKISTYTKYFREFERKYGNKLETHCGSWPDWWINYHGAHPFETGVNRRTHTDLFDSERLLSILKIEDPSSEYPAERIDKLYRKILLADEADWGSYTSVSEPDYLQSKGQTAEETSFVYQAAINTGEIAADSRMKIASMAGGTNKYGIVAINTLNWPRSEIVQVQVPGKLFGGRPGFRILDSENGSEMAWQYMEPTLHDRQTAKLRIAFTAMNVPALGFRTFDLVFDDSEESIYEARSGDAGSEIRNDFYKVSFDKDNGTIASIQDLGTGKDIIDDNSPYGFNQLIYEQTKTKRIVDLSAHEENRSDILYLQPYFRQLHDFYDSPKSHDDLVREVPKDGKITEIRKGKLYTEVISKTSLPLFPEITSYLTLDNYFKKIFIKNFVFKYETLDVEALYYAFPFKLEEPRFRLHSHGGYYEPEKEQLPGSCKDWYCTQKWVNLEGKEGSIDWSAIEAPMIQLGDINTGKWLHELEAKQATIMSFAMNNHWWTNSPASISGRFWFNFAFTSSKALFDPVRSHNFGWENHIPVTGNFIEFKEGKSGRKKYGLIEEVPENVMVIGFKQAEKGRGFMVRIMESAGNSTGFDFSLTGENIKRAFTANPVEERMSDLDVSGGKVKISLKPFEVLTFIIEM